MPSRSPTLEGFRAAFRCPSITFAEITWRWAVGGTAAILLAFCVVEYLGSLAVSGKESLFLRSRQPLLVLSALSNVLSGSAPRALLAGLIAALALTAIWIVAASVGRLATVRALLDYVRRDLARNVSRATSTDSDAPHRIVAGSTSEDTNGHQQDGSLPALMGLNFLRASVLLGSAVALFGVAIIVGFVSPDNSPQPGLAFLLFMPLAGLICFVGWALNWLLSLAAIFVVRNDSDCLRAISSAVALCQERTGAIIAVSTWTGLFHLALFIGASIAATAPLGLVRVIPVRLVLAGVLLVTLAYFAVADWIYTARLGGYVYIAEMPDQLPVPPLPAVPQVPPTVQTTIDRDEPILSDLPNLIVET